VVLLHVSTATGHRLLGPLADVGMVARDLGAVDANGDGVVGLVAASYEGKVTLLRQLAPIDSDADGLSDSVDNAPYDANATRIDMNTDGAVNASDQLDNDFDTVLGSPEEPSTWQRLGDPADPADEAGDPERNYYSCETCGLTEAESFQLVKVGYDTLVGEPAHQLRAALQRLRHGQPGSDATARVPELLREPVRGGPGLPGPGVQPRGELARALRPVRPVPRVGRRAGRPRGPRPRR
jgi:hypothetical protein